MHIIIGGGAIGYPLAKGLAEHHDVFIVDPDPARAERFADLDVEFVTGGNTNPDVLRRAGAGRCDLLIGATRLDEINIVACSLGSQLGARRTICFVTKEDLLDAHDGADSLRRHFGIDQVVWPEAELAADIERIIMEPDATDAAVFAGGRIQLLEFRLAADSPLAGRDVASLDLPAGVVIVALKHDDSTSIPRGRTRLAAGDRVVLMGTREGMAQSRLRVSPGDRPRSQLVTIVGGGDVGYRLAQRLDGAAGIRLRVIERDRERGELLASTLRNVLILCGDGTDLELLESEEIGRSDVLVSVIDNDERNLFASILGRQLGVRKVITGVGNWPNHRLFERVGVDVALSARGSAVTSVVHQIDGGRANLLAVLQEGQARVLEVRVPGDFAVTAVKHLGLPAGAIIGTVLRGMDVIVPRTTGWRGGPPPDLLHGDRGRRRARPVRGPGACAVEVSRQRNFQRDRKVAPGACAVEVSRQRNFQRDRKVAPGACAVAGAAPDRGVDQRLLAENGAPAIASRGSSRRTAPARPAPGARRSGIPVRLRRAGRRRRPTAARGGPTPS